MLSSAKVLLTASQIAPEAHWPSAASLPGLFGSQCREVGITGSPSVP